jgi:hypothetical protein
MVYEVKAGGYSIEWTNDMKAAMSAFNQSSVRDVKMYRLDRSTGKKYLIQERH